MITFILFFMIAMPAWSSGAQAVFAQSATTDKAASQASDTVELPADLDSDGIDGIVASMSDEQVRRLLLQELKKQVEADKAVETKGEEIGGLAGFIQRMREQVIFLRSRIEFLKSGVDVGFADDVPGIFLGGPQVCVKPGVLDGNGRLLAKELEEVQVGRAKLPRGIGCGQGDDPDQPGADLHR